MPKIPASERDAFYESRREALAEVALKLWAEQGFDQTSVEAIAREAGISKGTFYLYYESKDALLVDVLQRNSFVPDLLALSQDLARKSLDEAVHLFVRRAWRHLDEHRELVLLVLREMPTHLDEAREVAERVIVPTNRAVAGFLESRLGPERAREISSVISVRALVGMIVIVFLTHEILGVGQFLPVPEDQITKTLAELFLRGVVPATGGSS